MAKRRAANEEVGAEHAWNQSGWGLGDIRMTTDIYIREADGTGSHFPRRSADMPIVKMDMFGIGDQVEGNWRRESIDKKIHVPEYEQEESRKEGKKPQDMAPGGTWRRRSEDRKVDDIGDEIGGGGERKSTDQIFRTEERERRNTDGGV